MSIIFSIHRGFSVKRLVLACLTPEPLSGECLFFRGYRFPIEQPLLPLSFRLRRKPRQHQWRGLFETRCGLSRADWLKHLVHA
jgi:hypothetical protein